MTDLASYSEYVAEIERELSRIPRGSIEAKCLKVVLALGEAESLDQDALKEWTTCIANDSFCDNTIEHCAIDKPDKGICPPGFPDDLSDDFGFRMWRIVRAGRQMRADWESASKKVERAKALLVAAGTPERTTIALPRSETAVAKSVVGRAAQLLCSGDAVPSDAVEPCQELRDVLIQGVAADEESDLNAALSGLVDAYQLGT